MTKINNTKAALISSVLSMFLCFTMLLGTTFAWFTDTVTSGSNVIQSGTLKVDLVDANNNSMKGRVIKFVAADGGAQNEILWEPGCTYKTEPVKVVNKGSLALKYQIVINGIDGDAKLLEAIEWTVTVGNTTTDIDLADLKGELKANETSGAIVLSGHMMEEAGIEYQNLSVEGISISVFATQSVYEPDSFDDQYDGNAPYGNDTNNSANNNNGANNNDANNNDAGNDVSNDAGNNGGIIDTNNGANNNNGVNNDGSNNDAGNDVSNDVSNNGGSDEANDGGNNDEAGPGDTPSVDPGQIAAVLSGKQEEDEPSSGGEAGEAGEAPSGPKAVTTAEQLAAILTSDDENIAVFLVNDIDLPISSLGSITPGSGEYKLGGANTETITIDLNGHHLNIATTYWSAIGAKNNNATITIKNGSISNTGNSATTWNAYDIRLCDCRYVIEDVTFDKAIALESDAALKNVTIKETHDYYALWITAEGQTVTIDGLTVNGGRGIKIDEQYVGNPEKVTLHVSNATFATAEKAAIMVNSAAGADITLSDVNISGVAADSTNAVWVDADAADSFDLVTVDGGSKAQEQ